MSKVASPAAAKKGAGKPVATPEGTAEAQRGMSSFDFPDESAFPQPREPRLSTALRRLPPMTPAQAAMSKQADAMGEKIQEDRIQLLRPYRPAVGEALDRDVEEGRSDMPETGPRFGLARWGDDPTWGIPSRKSQAEAWDESSGAAPSWLTTATARERSVKPKMDLEDRLYAEGSTMKPSEGYNRLTSQGIGLYGLDQDRGRHIESKIKPAKIVDPMSRVPVEGYANRRASEEGGMFGGLPSRSAAVTPYDMVREEKPEPMYTESKEYMAPGSEDYGDLDDNRRFARGLARKGD